MKNTFLIISVGASLAIAACSTESNQNTAEDKQNNVPEAVKTDSVSMEADVPFIQANNYFVKNTYQEGQLANPKITSQEEFDKIFGMATVMGENGKPTPIDFSKQYVIAVIGQTTDNATETTVSSLKQKENTITLNYQVIQGKKQTSSITPFILIIVDNKYQGEVKAEKS